MLTVFQTAIKVKMWVCTRATTLILMFIGFYVGLLYVNEIPIELNEIPIELNASPSIM